MHESYGRRRLEMAPEVIKRRIFRDISHESQFDGELVIERFVKCDGEVHIIEIETTKSGSIGDSEYPQIQQVGEPTPCTCSDEEKQRGDSVWSVFK